MTGPRRRHAGRVTPTIAGLVLLAACAVPEPEETPTPAPEPAAGLIPAPAEIVAGTGTLDARTLGGVTVSDPADSALRELAGYVADLLAPVSGPVPVGPPATATTPAPALSLRLEDDGATAPEAYRLAVSPEGVTIAAATHAGLFYGIQTLRQLLTTAPDGTIGAVTIRDEPRFPYRGMHLDVGRHFQPVAFVKRYIDLLALYKMNTFHWHLTEDQGWRIEIERYPRLTEVGACRKETILARNFDPYVGDGTPHCGFYTQDEIREVVAYAASRYVTVIPEIEMPGHSVAALAAYPELACTDGPFEVATVWGVHEDIYCPSEETFAFLENVLTEVMALFPGTYIHIGGDEAPKARWEESALAQAVIRDEGLTDEHELQSWFLRRIERFLRAHGRRLIGWDEILEGGLAPDATVMSWRGTAGGIEAARQGHDVIMTPTSHVYFDYYQGDPAFEPLAIGGFTPLERVYAFEPVPDVLTAAEARHVLGAQGNVWTEYLKTPESIEYMAFPRLLALAEVVWSPRDRRDWDDFIARLGRNLSILDALDVNYRVPDVDGLGRDRLTLDEAVTVTLRSPMPDAEIRYTLDGSDPARGGNRYAEPLTLTVGDTGTTVTARAVRPDGRTSAPRSATFRRATLRPAESVDDGALAPGVRYAYYEFDRPIRSVRALEALTPKRRGVTDDVAIGAHARDERFGYVFEGFVRVPADGIYDFGLTSDDGARLWIGDALVVDHDGPHGASEREGSAALAAGRHPVRVAFFQSGGGMALSVRMRGGDGTWGPLDLAHRRDAASHEP